MHRDMCLDLAKQKGVHLTTFQDVYDFMKGDVGEHLRTLLPEVTKLLKTGSDCPCNILLLREVIFWDAPTENVSTVDNGASPTKSRRYNELSQRSGSTAGP